MRDQKFKTLRRFDKAFQPRFVTFSCFQRQAFLARPKTCQWFLDALTAQRIKEKLWLASYVLMPTHVHIIIVPSEGVALASLLQSIKQSVARRAISWVRQNAPHHLVRMRESNGGEHRPCRFWQRGGGYDRNIRSAEEFHEKTAYIHKNPVRAGLAANPIDWPWSSANAWETGEDAPIAIDRHVVPPLVT